MQQQLDALLGKIKQDYVNWCTAGGSKPLSGYFQDSINEWDSKVQVKTVQKFIKCDIKDKKFKKGDLLKAAGFNAPARNAARGNIFDDDYHVNWTDSLYLK